MHFSNRADFLIINSWKSLLRKDQQNAETTDIYIVCFIVLHQHNKLQRKKTIDCNLHSTINITNEKVKPKQSNTKTKNLINENLNY